MLQIIVFVGLGELEDTNRLVAKLGFLEDGCTDFGFSVPHDLLPLGLHLFFRSSLYLADIVIDRFFELVVLPGLLSDTHVADF